MIVGVLNIDWQTLADGVALGSIYALMAVGIGLVFGVLRLVNFAYGQLVMAGAFALALASDWGWPVWAGIALCLAVVLVLSALMDLLVFRPLRGQSPAVMLVATFAVAFLLENIALIWFGSLGKIASSLAYLNRPVTIGNVDIRKITIVAVIVAVVCLASLFFLLERTTIGLHMRASSMDSETARLLGVRANRVIAVAVLISGVLAAIVAVMLTVQTPLVTPDFALNRHDRGACRRRARWNEPVDSRDTRRLPHRIRQRHSRGRAADESESVPPDLSLRRRHPRLARSGLAASSTSVDGRARMKFLVAVQEVVAPAVLVIGAALLGTVVSQSTQTYFTDALVKVAIVVALYVFIGNSGVVSFGHISFVAVGAWTAGVLSVPVSEKPAIMPNLAHSSRIARSGTSPRSCSRRSSAASSPSSSARRSCVCPGLAAGIATFGVLEITHNLLRYEETIGPGLNAFSSVPETTGLGQAAIGALVAVLIAFVYARSRFGRLLRATREDAAAARAIGASVHVQRLIAFTLSGVIAGLAGGLYVHLLPIQTESVYLDLTFITLAMLVVGGASSLFGAVVGALSVSALDSYLAVAENGSSFLGWHFDLPTGTSELVVGVLMAAILILKPSGITGGREFRFIRRSGA